MCVSEREFVSVCVHMCVCVYYGKRKKKIQKLRKNEKKKEQKSVCVRVKRRHPKKRGKNNPP